MAQIAQELGVSNYILYKWRKQSRESGALAFPGNSKVALTAEQQENVRLKKELERVKQERDILKKAVGFFARESRYWQSWNTALRQRLRKELGREAEPTAAIMDSQSIKTAEGGNSRGFDAYKRCSGCKRNILVDTRGLLLAVLVTGANVQDRDGAKQLLTSFYQAFFQSFRLKRIWAAVGYQGALISWTQAAFAWTLDIVRRNKHQAGFELLPKRWLVERTFSWLVRNRRLSRDYERLPQTSEAFIYVAIIRLMTKRLAEF